MYACEIHAKKLLPSDLDNYLAKGFFRIGQKIFTTAFISFERHIYNTIWLRINLREFSLKKSQAQAQKKCKDFTVKVNRLKLSDEIEALYRKYINSRPFYGSSSVASLLFEGGTPKTVFNSFQVEIYDGTKLIGVGVFDKGLMSAEGICSFYDPNYEKYSLGKFIILQKILHCIDLKMDYFYPGYIVPDYSAFDYKLSLSENGIEYFEPRSEKWISIDLFDKEKIELNTMIQKLIELHTALDPSSMARLYRYTHFYWNVIPSEHTFLQYPLILYLKNKIKPKGIEAVVFDTRSDEYKVLVLCSKSSFQYVYGELLYCHKVLLSTRSFDEIFKYCLQKIK